MWKPTPGPWVATEYKNIVMHPKGFVCKIHAPAMWQMNEADAVLIAAAPELLEACIEALSYFGAGLGTSDPGDAVRQKLSLAITKATNQEKLR